MVQFFVKIISAIATTIVLGVLLSFIMKSNEKESLKSQNAEHIVVHLPKAYMWVGVIVVLFLSIFLFWATVSPIVVNMDIWTYVIFCIFILMGLVLVVEPFIWKIHIFQHEDYFLYTTGFGRTYKVQYADIVYYKDGENTLTLRIKHKRFFVDNKATNYGYLHTMILQKGVKKHPKSRKPVV